MQDARRRPGYMVKEGNAADDRPGRNPEGDGARWRSAGTNACFWAHLFVGTPRNIDILLRALLLDLHPSSPPSHTCLVMKQVLVRAAGGVSRAVAVLLGVLHLLQLLAPVLGVLAIL